ncbi:bifunctional diguanylate cyclase/phosphodiesterase [Legionella sp. CNM-4043-24]|uniref:bifunctional diguanylate cyclase/phosphodiesterase n=1 Tax=Legionella sp. CNM-4043-24 TaxID=3421646 RepID=UPI00403AF56C
MRTRGGSGNTALYNLTVMFFYVTSGYLGLMLAVPPGYATAIWAPSGIALGAVLVWGLRTLPGIFAGSFLLNFYVTLVNAPAGFSLVTLLTGGITGTGAVLQALTGWWLIKRYVGFHNPLHIPKDILMFALLSGPVSCVVATSVSNAGLYAIGIMPPENIMASWITWWIGDIIGVLIMTPVFLILFARPRQLWRNRIIPILMPLCLTFFVVIFAHFFYRQSELNRVNEKFSIMSHQQMHSGLDTSSTSYTHFLNREYSWLVWSSLTATLLFCALMNIILFILYGQRYLIQYLADAKTIQLRTEKAKNLLLLNAAGEGIFWIDTDYNITFINQAAENLLGYSSHELKDQSIMKVLYEANHEKPSFYIQKSPVYQAIREKTVIKIKEAMFWRKDNSCFWVEYTCIPIIISDQVKGAAIIFSDITERLDNENKLMRMAHFDPLTKLPNRLSFFEHLEYALGRASRNQSQLAICFIDVDNFKYINDTFGHLYGDKLLTVLPGLIMPHLRDIDYLARIGGDEFGLIFEDTPKSTDLTKVIERILQAFKEPLSIDDNEISASISIGIAMYPANGHQIETLLQNADIAMYQAKKMGKSTFAFYSKEANEKILIYNQIESALQTAIREKSYQVYYQPMIHAGTHQILGVEALLRWSDDVLKNVPLTDSIFVAEDKGYIHDLGIMILEQAFREFRDLSNIRNGMQLAINVSIKQFKNPLFNEKIQALIEQYQVNPKKIFFEITENSFNKDSDLLVDMMMGLKSLGIHFSLDDFGVGSSSIHLLKKLPLSSIKIDQSFIKDIDVNPDDAMIVLTAIQLSHGLGITTIAEGVEKMAQLDLLEQWGCNIIQGYYFAHPMPMQELLRWMEQHEGELK